MGKHGKHKPSGDYWLFGHHAVEAALANRQRQVLEVRASKAGQEKMGGWVDSARHPALKMVDGRELEKLLPPGAVHQGMAIRVKPLENISLSDILKKTDKRPLVLLDQVTDPHNVGAILRSAAAFDIAAVVVTSRHAPEEGGIIAKSASGALEIVPMIEVGNLAKTIDEVKKAGYWVAGLDGAAEQTLSSAKLGKDTALVMGAEGKGLRRLSAEKCDLLVKLPMSERMESLNVSNAAAIALYSLYTA